MPPPRKRLGQHFLTDKRILARVVDALDPQPGEMIVEIGPGRGALTDLLAARASHVLAIELDRVLAAELRQRYEEAPNVRVVEGDALDIELASLVGAAPWSVTGNVPYYITTPLLFHALRSPRPRCIVFLIQREVGDRLAAKAGDEAYGALTVTARAVADVSRHGRVLAGAFHPPPAVESIIVRLTPLAVPLVAPAEEAPFRTLVQGAFSQRRKQMLRVVRGLFDLAPDRAAQLLDAAQIEHDARPEVLPPEAFVRLLHSAGTANLRVAPVSAPRRSRRDSTAQN
ncbi:MAG: 16S rRNA (adenine(1518)-N(6)/adenine(1519)-N(6))-dimethyltransferase RsmA [Gemmatimonadota bacterium]